MAANVEVSSGIYAPSSTLGTSSETSYPPETLIAAAIKYNRLGIEEGFDAFDQVANWRVRENYQCLHFVNFVLHSFFSESCDCDRIKMALSLWVIS